MTSNQPKDLPLELEDAIFIIFGITGDLVKRKLLPSLYQLANLGLLPKNFKILGTTRRQTEVGEIITALRETLDNSGQTINEAATNRLKQSLELVHMDIARTEDYAILKNQVDNIENNIGKTMNRLFYLAVPPQLFPGIVESLKEYDLHITPNPLITESRLLLEKPFGHDTASAVELIKKMEKVFSEDAIYRVDHYLAKETAQNILTFRFNNPLFKAAWDNQSIAHILITASEAITIEGRVNFYEQTGALRDLIQSHLLQLLALIAMEEPADRSAEALHHAKRTLLESIVPIRPSEVADHTVRGQYQTYRQEVGNPESMTETYAAIKLEIDNSRWHGVPILLRTGKAMSEKVTEITLVFKDKKNFAVHDSNDEFNTLTIRIQPNEGIVLNLLAKKPSLHDEKEMVQMKFFYEQSFSDKQLDAYERVLIDAIRGDKSLFTSDKEVLASWKIIENVLIEWQSNHQSLEIYQNGYWGPKQADVLAASVGASWVTAYNSNNQLKLIQ